MRNEVFFQKNKLTFLKQFSVLHEGWECDYIGYVCKNDRGENVLVLTNHGQPYIANKQELKDKIEEYKKVIKESEDSLSLLS